MADGTWQVDTGWGSRVFDPVGGEAPLSLGANRNLLADNRSVDPLSGTAAINDVFVAVAPVRSPVRSAAQSESVFSTQSGERGNGSS